MSNHQITLSTGETIQLEVATGNILDNQHSSSTSVYSSGGGGYLGPQGGYVAPVRVDSVTNTRQSIWIQNENGLEREIRFTNQSISVRTGQKISGYWVKAKGNKSPVLQGIYNHSTDKYWDWLSKCNVNLAVGRKYLGAKLQLITMLAGVTLAGFGYLTSPKPEGLTVFPPDVMSKISVESTKSCTDLLGYGGKLPVKTDRKSRYERRIHANVCAEQLKSYFPKEKIDGLPYSIHLLNANVSQENIEIRAEAASRSSKKIGTDTESLGVMIFIGGLILRFFARSFQKFKVRSEFDKKLRDIISHGKLA